MNRILNASNSANRQEEWLRILGKGMVTIPSLWRKELGFEPGKLIKAKKSGKKVILEPQEENAPYRIYSDSEIKNFLKDDAFDK